MLEGQAELRLAVTAAPVSAAAAAGDDGWLGEGLGMVGAYLRAEGLAQSVR